MDREEECVCCHEIELVVYKNDKVFLHEKPPTPYRCVTDKPGFHTVCLNRWVLQVAWLQYKQEHGSRAYQSPKHWIFWHVTYSQLVRWCWEVIGKDVRVVLPSCAVSCIRAHYPPPGDEDDFVFVGFHFPDE